MVAILRKLENYSVVKDTDNGNKSLHYYIDNGETVSEYMDIYDIQDFLCCGDIEFISLCNSVL